MNNIKLNNFLTQTHWLLNNIRLNRMVDKISQIDSICDYEYYREMVLHLKKMGLKSYDIKLFNKESLYYGHLNSLLSYSGYVNTNRLYVPMIEHGINFSIDPLPKTTIDMMPAIVFQGKYKEKYVRELNEKKPVFCIGPFIQYVEPFYDALKTEKLHKENGKTVTIFPTHTYEGSQSEYDREKYVYDMIEYYARDFSTINVCVYWNDVSDLVYDIFKKNGANLLSSGLRQDANFICRLKTIIELSDHIAGNDVGSYIGYAINMGKTVELYDSKIEENDSHMNDTSAERQKNIKSEILKMFSSCNSAHIMEYLDTYWGFSIKQFSRIEMYYLFELVERIVYLSNGNYNSYDKSYERTISEFVRMDDSHRIFIENRLGEKGDI